MIYPKTSSIAWLVVSQFNFWIYNYAFVTVERSMSWCLASRLFSYFSSFNWQKNFFSSHIFPNYSRLWNGYMHETNDFSDIGRWMALLSHTFLDHVVLFPCRACDLQMAVADSINWKKNTKMFIIRLFYIFPSLLVGLFYNG